MCILQLSSQAVNKVDQYISIKNSNLHIAIYSNNEFRLVDKDIPVKNYLYFDKPKVSYDKKYINIQFGDMYMCSIGNADTPNICENNFELSTRLTAVKMDRCTLIVNHAGLCLTKGQEIPLKRNGELEAYNLDIKSEYDTLSFFDCNRSAGQCFVFENVDKESPESVQTRETEPKKQKKLEEEVEKDTKFEKIMAKNKDIKKPYRKYEKVKDYDLRYNNKNLDDAHHFLADSDPDAILSRKHYAPDCFYGYNSLNLFINDPLPHLRKLKQKYCFFNRKDIVRNKL